jgi:hypothetical protein
LTQADNYETWARHIGQSTLNADLVQDLYKAGISQPPIIQRDLLQVSINVGNLTLFFYDPILIGYDEPVGDGVGVLSGITIHLDDTSGLRYTGDLPYSIDATDTRKSLRRRLGRPDDSDDEEHWDEWTISDLQVTAMYSEDFEKLETLMVFIPETE